MKYALIAALLLSATPAMAVETLLTAPPDESWSDCASHWFAECFAYDVFPAEGKMNCAPTWTPKMCKIITKMDAQSHTHAQYLKEWTETCMLKRNHRTRAECDAMGKSLTLEGLEKLRRRKAAAYLQKYG